MTLVDQGLNFLVAFIILGAGAVPVVTGTLVTDTTSITGETYTPSDSLPSTISLNNIEDGIVEDSETVYLDETGDNSNLIELVEGDDYQVNSYDDGEIEILSGGTNSQDYNTTEGDEIQADYSYKPSGYVGGTAGTIIEFVPLLIVLALFVAAIGMVR